MISDIMKTDGALIGLGAVLIGGLSLASPAMLPDDVYFDSPVRDTISLLLFGLCLHKIGRNLDR